MHFVYILYSPEADRFYTGETAFPEGRLQEHRAGKYIRASTKFANDWYLIKTIECKNRKDALVVERFIKSMKSGRFIYNLVHDAIFFEKFKLLVRQKFGIEISK